MLTTKGRDFVRYALKPTAPHERDIFLHTVANKVAGATKMRPTELNIFNFVDDRRSTYIRTGIDDVFLTPAVVSWLKAVGITKFTGEQAALITAQLRGQSAMLCATPGTGKTLATAIAACHKFMHSSITTRCHTLCIVPNAAAARCMAGIMRSVAGTAAHALRVMTDTVDFAATAQRLHDAHPHAIIGTVPALTLLLEHSTAIFGLKLRKLVDTLIVDDADSVLEQPGGLELITRLYRRERDEISAQLIFLSATIDSETQRRFNLLTKDEQNVFRLSDSHFEYALPTGASFYLYCDRRLREEQILMRLLQNVQWIKGESFRPLLVASDPVKSLELGNALQANGLLVQNDSVETLGERLLEEQAGNNEPDESALTAIVRDECASGVVFPTNRIRLTDCVSLRGVGYPKVSDVFLFGDVPPSKSFVHAAGRTARFGASGDVNMIFTPERARAMHQLCEVHDIPFKVSSFE